METPFDETSAALSPDGRFLAYQSDESGRWEISLLKLTIAAGLRFPCPADREPVWSANGNALFYRAPDALMRVAIDGNGPANWSACNHPCAQWCGDRWCCGWREASRTARG